MSTIEGLFPDISRRSLGIGLFLLVITISILWLMNRPFICKCGYLKLWQTDVFSPEISQHLMDWYTFTHVLHGLLLFGGLRWFFDERSTGELLVVAVGLECGWEIVENTEYVIDYYRQNTMAVAFYGDTILNSTFDVLAMVVGFLIANRVSVWISVAIFIVIEAVLILVIRDSLTLNVMMLLYPIEAIKNWQMALA